MHKREPSVDELRKVAQLACLTLDPSDEDRARRDFSSLIDFVEKVSEVDTDGVEPMWTPLEDKYTLRVRADHTPDIEREPDASIGDMPFVQQVPHDLGAAHVDRMLEGAVDAVPPFFTTPKSVGLGSTEDCSDKK